jgi:hypothetical protein
MHAQRFPTAQLVFVAAALIIGAFVVSDLVLYTHWLVPTLARRQSVPVGLWLVVFAPLVLAGLSGGLMLRTNGQVVAAATASAAGIQTYVWLAASTGAPGYHKSYAVEAPLLHWSVGLLAIAVACGTLLIIGRRFRQWRVRRSAA